MLFCAKVNLEWNVNNSPNNHLGHLVSCPEPLIVDPDHWDDPGDVLNELLIGRVQILQVLKGDGGLTLTLPHVNTTLALCWRHVKVDNQVRLLPVYWEERSIIESTFSPMSWRNSPQARLKGGTLNMVNSCRDRVIVSHKLHRSENPRFYFYFLVHACCCHGNRRDSNSHKVGQVAKEGAVRFILPFLHHPGVFQNL